MKKIRAGKHTLYCRIPEIIFAATVVSQIFVCKMISVSWVVRQNMLGENAIFNEYYIIIIIKIRF